MRSGSMLALTTAALLLPGPTVALAAHHKQHTRHHRHTHHARVIHFGRADSSAGRTGTTGTAGPAGTTGTATTSPPAGKVASFTAGVLTITLSDGSKVSGTVTSDTRIECQAQDEETTMHSDFRNDGGGSSDEATGSDETTGSDDMSGGDGSDDTGDDEANACSTAALMPGTVVREAELKLTSSGSIWDSVTLEAPSSSTTANSET